MTININFDYSKVRGSTQLHNKFKKEFIISCSKVFPNVVILPYDVGFFRAYSQPDIVVRCGQDGVPDTIVLGDGWYLLFDMKTGRAKLQDNQKNFKERVKEVNGGTDRVFKINSVSEGMLLIRRYYQ